jgi:rhodanese-related sulfurtransferase
VRRKILTALREAVIIAVVVVAVGLSFNALRGSGIPVIAVAGTFRIQTEAEFLKVEDARRLFEQGQVVFVDARDRSLFLGGHIEGAVNVPPDQTGVEDLAWLSDVDSDIVCYASEESQRQAGVVADKLIEMGAPRVFVLYGGFEAWKGAGLPTGTG